MVEESYLSGEGRVMDGKRAASSSFNDA